MQPQLDEQRVQALLNHPEFQALVKKRVGLGWTLTIIQLIIYFGFILLVTLAPDFVKTPVNAGEVTTWAIPLGIMVILSTFILSGIYVWYANSQFDELTRRVVAEVYHA